MSNRAYRRAVSHSNPTPAQLSKALDTERLNGIQAAVKAMRKVVAYELLRRGWKSETIIQFVDKITYTFDSVDKDYITLQGIDEILKEERGIEL